MDDDTLVAQFEDLTLPFDCWTHEAHLRVTFVYLRRHPFGEALECVRRGIRAYNAANDVPEGPTSGYNETTTVAFVHLVHTTMQAYGSSHPTPDGRSFCATHPHLMQKTVLRLFYSPEHRLHPDAKATYVEPDLTPLPTWPPPGAVGAVLPEQ